MEFNPFHPDDQPPVLEPAEIEVPSAAPITVPPPPTGPIVGRTAWLAERRKGIGGSDVAAILGVSPYRTALEVYLDKRGELIDQPENDAMRWGSRLEPVVRQEYSDQTGRAVLVPDHILRHDRHDFMLANLDGFTEDGRIFEAKTARSGQGWGDPGTDEVPQGYLFQVQHYMAVTGYPVADVAVLIGGSDFRIYTVEADRDLHNMLVDAEAAFWQRVVDADPPEPVSMADVKALWGRFSREQKIEATPDLLQALEDLRGYKTAIAELEELADSRKLAIMAALGEADTLVDTSGRPLVTWKAGKAPERLNGKALKADYPEIHALYAAPGTPSRTFLIK